MAKLVLVNGGKEEELPNGGDIKKVCDENFGIPFGCEDGICGTCRIKVVEGANNLTPKNQKEEDMLPNEPNERLACQCKINQGVVKIEY